MSKRWSSEVTIKFLEGYEANPCLWDVTSKAYNRDLRDIAYHNISEVMNIPGFNSDAVKAKIRSIRNTYILEITKIRDSKKSGKGTDELYQPKVAWFPKADKILREVVQIRESQSAELINQNAQHIQQSQDHFTK